MAPLCNGFNQSVDRGTPLDELCQQMKTEDQEKRGPTMEGTGGDGGTHPFRGRPSSTTEVAGVSILCVGNGLLSLSGAVTAHRLLCRQDHQKQCWHSASDAATSHPPPQKWGKGKRPWSLKNLRLSSRRRRWFHWVLPPLLS